MPNPARAVAPVTVATLSRSAITRVGAEALLRQFDDRVTIWAAGPGARPAHADVVLLEVLTTGPTDHGALVAAAAWPARLVPIVPVDRPDIVSFCLDLGAHACVRADITGDQLVEVVEAVAAGTVSAGSADLSGLAHPAEGGMGIGLTAREQQVLAGLVQGLSNVEIADALFLSVNSVKTYVRTTYRKIGVVSRGQAAAWAIAQGVGSPVRPSGTETARRTAGTVHAARTQG